MAGRPPLGELIVTAAELGELLGLGVDMVHKHVRENGMPRKGNGRYPVAECVVWYVDRIKTAASEKGDERRKLTRAQRIRAEIEIDIRRGELIEVDKYRGDLLSLATAFSKIDNQAPRIGAEIGLTHGDIRKLDAELRAFRLAVSRDILARAGIVGSGDDPGTTKEPKRGTVGRRKPRATTKRAGAGPVAH